MGTIDKYLIAGHYLRVEGSPEREMLPRIPGFEVFAVTDGPDEWIVRFGCDVTLPAGCTTLETFDFADGVMSCEFLLKEQHYFFLMRSPEQGEPLLLLHYGGGNTVEVTHTDDESAMRFGMWMAVGLLAAPYRMLLIHSSTIVHQDKAVLFLGESGTGKSTHTRLWLKHIPDSHLLNDDSPALAIEDGKPVAYGSPWSGKTHCYHPYRFPVAAIVRLSQAPYNKIRRLSVLEAVAAIQPSCPPALAQDEHYADRVMDIISDTIASVPVFHLECLPDAAAAQTSHDAIFGSSIVK